MAYEIIIVVVVKLGVELGISEEYVHDAWGWRMVI